MAAAMKVVQQPSRVQNYQFELGSWRTRWLCFTTLAEYEFIIVTATVITTVVSSGYPRILLYFRFRNFTLRLKVIGNWLTCSSKSTGWDFRFVQMATKAGFGPQVSWILRSYPFDQWLVGLPMSSDTTAIIGVVVSILKWPVNED